MRAPLHILQTTRKRLLKISSSHQCWRPFFNTPSRRWKGLPESVTRSGLGTLQREKLDRERSLDKKKGQLAELLVQQIAFRNLARRNRFRTSAKAATAAETGDDGANCPGGEQDPDDVAASKVRPCVV